MVDIEISTQSWLDICLIPADTCLHRNVVVKIHLYCTCVLIVRSIAHYTQSGDYVSWFSKYLMYMRFECRHTRRPAVLECDLCSLDPCLTCSSKYICVTWRHIKEVMPLKAQTPGWKLTFFAQQTRCLFKNDQNCPFNEQLFCSV